ncbi:MAG TPA: hypothetical protein VGQ39_07975 [Pyrinomonadaceae bacterium]|jgi:hypothetical protein|nr:hypothetical protein [Pyrinomonadaceae bacterium]
MDSNFGTNPNLLVDSAGNVYIKFKLSSTLPVGTPGSAVEGATLKLYLTNVTTAGSSTSMRLPDLSFATVIGVGIGTTAPPRRFQIGGDTNAFFTFDPSDASPNAGFIRFGDNTGWKLHIGRNRESSGGGLNNTSFVITI